MAKSKSIYADIIPGLPKLPPEDQSRQDKLDEFKTLLPSKDPNHIARVYYKLRCGGGPKLTPQEFGQFMVRLGKEGLTELLSEVNFQLEAYEQLLVASQQAKEEGWGKYGVGDNALRLEDGTTIRVQQEPYGKVMDKEAFRVWCCQNGYERQLQLWPSSMNSIVKERLKAGENVPDGTEAFSYDKIVFTAGKK
jgi:hypothetical protein